MFKRAGLIDGGVIPLSSALRADEGGYVAALTAYRYDGDARADALNHYVEQFLTYVESATVAAGHFVDAASAVHERWSAAVEGVRADAGIRRAFDIVAENPLVSTAFLAEHLRLSVSRASKLVKQLVEVGILAPATGKYRKSQLYQANDIFALLSFGAEARPHTPTPERLVARVAGREGGGLTHRCGAPTSTGPCRNRVPAESDRCWRHR